MDTRKVVTERDGQGRVIASSTTDISEQEAIMKDDQATIEALQEALQLERRKSRDSWHDGYATALSGKPQGLVEQHNARARASQPQLQKVIPFASNYEGFWIYLRAFRTDNEKVVIGIPGEVGSTAIATPLAGTPKQVRSKLMQYVGEKFDEWMAMEPPSDKQDEYDKARHGEIVDPMEVTEEETSHEDHPDRDTFRDPENVPTAQSKTLPFPSTSGKTGQSDEDDNLVGD